MNGPHMQSTRVDTLLEVRGGEDTKEVLNDISSIKINHNSNT